jgi:hypothetical protein
MIQQAIFKRRYTCGEHIKGRGRHVSTHGKAISAGQMCVIEKGVIVMLPGKRGDPYTVLDEQSFITLEAQEEDLSPLAERRL